MPEAEAYSIAALEFSTYVPLGDDTFDIHTAPIGAEIPEATLSIAAALSRALAVERSNLPLDRDVEPSSDSTMLTSGTHDVGQLGDDPTADRPSPARVVEPNDGSKDPG
jgi:hypothetical protein